MKHKLLVLVLSLLLTGCALIIIGPKKQQTAIAVTQQSPLGAIYLFKTELDSNNIAAAARYFARPEGSALSAMEKLDLYDDLDRLRRIIDHKSVTHIFSDSLTTISYRIRMELDYYRIVTFSTRKINNSWFITQYKDS